MPDSGHMPRRWQAAARGLGIAGYALVAWEAAFATQHDQDVLHQVLGNPGANFLGLLAAIMAASCAFSHLYHQWLVERGLLPWLMTSILVYALAYRELILVALVCLMGVRLIHLEVFAHKQPARKLLTSKQRLLRRGRSNR